MAILIISILKITKLFEILDLIVINANKKKVFEVSYNLKSNFRKSKNMKLIKSKNLAQSNYYTNIKAIKFLIFNIKKIFI